MGRVFTRAATAIGFVVAVFLTGCSSAPETRSYSASGSAVSRAAGSSQIRIDLTGTPPFPGTNNDRFAEAPANGWQSVAEAPVSTFSLDVDTASYAFARRQLRDGHLPPKAAVRVEEMVNYFPYAYAGPEKREDVMRATATVVPSPWKPGAKLLHVGLKGWDVARTSRPRANLTFLIDVSGSMAPDDRLPLIQKALHQLGEGLRGDDKVAIVTYAGEAGIRLPPTSGSDLPTIMAAVDSLRASGGTAGGAGITTAYGLAEGMFDRNAINRVILATDGDFNLGETNPKRLEEIIAGKRRSGIYLTVLGVGIGNLNDALMQRLAQAGNGQAAYLDSILEARKVFIEEMGSTMVPLADDAKIQVEFNPALVSEYRLVGYETRMLKTTDFANDRVDAGEIGSGHSVTAIYEFMPKGAANSLVEPLRYGKPKKLAAAAIKSNEYAFVKLRHKAPGGTESRLTSWPVGHNNERASLADSATDLRFSVAIAGFAQMLRGEVDATPAAWDATIALADGARGADPQGWRAEAVQLMRAAKGLR